MDFEYFEKFNKQYIEFFNDCIQMIEKILNDTQKISQEEKEEIVENPHTNEEKEIMEKENKSESNKKSQYLNMTIDEIKEKLYSLKKGEEWNGIKRVNYNIYMMTDSGTASCLQPFIDKAIEITKAKNLFYKKVLQDESIKFFIPYYKILLKYLPNPQDRKIYSQKSKTPIHYWVASEEECILVDENGELNYSPKEFVYGYIPIFFSVNWTANKKENFTTKLKNLPVGQKVSGIKKIDKNVYMLYRLPISGYANTLRRRKEKVFLSEEEQMDRLKFILKEENLSLHSLHFFYPTPEYIQSCLPKKKDRIIYAISEENGTELKYWIKDKEGIEYIVDTKGSIILGEDYDMAAVPIFFSLD